MIKALKHLLKIVNYKLIIALVILLSLILNLKSAPAAHAQTMSNGNYIIQMGNLNMSAGRPTGSGYKLLTTLGQTGPGLYSGTNYKVRAGFEYILSKIPFRFSISSIFVDFGSVSPGNPVYRTNQLTISNGSAFGYQVMTSQNHNLRNDAYGVDIGPTACDSGFTCDTGSANQWQTPIAFGFGYNCTNVFGTDCALDFTNSSYYRPFISSPSAVMVMHSSSVGRNRQAKITYQLNVSNVQAAGQYHNVINYIATPTF
jgi:hypothetical protein